MFKKALFAFSAYAVTGLVMLGLQQASKTRQKRTAGYTATADELTPLFI